MGGSKTVVGTAAFVLVTALVGAALTGLSFGRLPVVATAALALAAVEGSMGYGLDNLPLPPVASLLAISWLGL
jgi:dolichol kinase